MSSVGLKKNDIIDDINGGLGSNGQWVRERNCMYK